MKPVTQTAKPKFVWVLYRDKLLYSVFLKSRDAHYERQKLQLDGYSKHDWSVKKGTLHVR